ncbi:hypothetical protein M0802_007516 [Mischocyttarus mexicanus]|nr:hypothetical protein M0802_007516 [Mischocyttarus mexicanus]
MVPRHAPECVCTLEHSSNLSTTQINLIMEFKPVSLSFPLITVYSIRDLMKLNYLGVKLPNHHDFYKKNNKPSKKATSCFSISKEHHINKQIPEKRKLKQEYTKYHQKGPQKDDRIDKRQFFWITQPNETQGSEEEELFKLNRCYFIILFGCCNNQDFHIPSGSSEAVTSSWLDLGTGILYFSTGNEQTANTPGYPLKQPEADATASTGTSDASGASGAGDFKRPIVSTHNELCYSFSEGKSDKEILDDLLQTARYDKRLLPPVQGTLRPPPHTRQDDYTPDLVPNDPDHPEHLEHHRHRYHHTAPHNHSSLLTPRRKERTASSKQPIASSNQQPTAAAAASNSNSKRALSYRS